MQSRQIATFAWSKNRRIINMLALLLDDHLKEGACMKYINARNILPDALVKELQGYMQGGYLYIPSNQAQKKRWGEASGYRQELQQRNRQIVAEFQNGTSMAVSYTHLKPGQLFGNKRPGGHRDVHEL